MNDLYTVISDIHQYMDVNCPGAIGSMSRKAFAHFGFTEEQTDHLYDAFDIYDPHKVYGDVMHLKKEYFDLIANHNYTPNTMMKLLGFYIRLLEFDLCVDKEKCSYQRLKDFSREEIEQQILLTILEN